MTALSSMLIEKVLREAMDRLEGDWVLVGGSLLVAKRISTRATVDIDLIGLSNPTQGDSLKLMEVASENGLPVEALNQAASYFVLKIPELRSHLELWISGHKGKLYQPDLYLYVRTKIGRLSESDTEDALLWIRDRLSSASSNCIQETIVYVDSLIVTTTDARKKKDLVTIRAALTE